MSKRASVLIRKPELKKPPLTILCASGMPSGRSRRYQRETLAGRRVCLATGRRRDIRAGR